MLNTTYCNYLQLTGICFVAFILASGFLCAQPRISQAHSSLRQGADGLETIENGQIKVGINTNYGGAITYLAFLDSHGDSVGTTNMVNNPDLGRQIQIALYSGPISYPGYPGLGWNPIQAGDAYLNPSQVIAVEKQQNLLYAKTIPKQFGINNEPGEATIEHWIRLEGNVVKVHAKVVMARSDKTQYEARQQEFPCVYLNGDYHNMWYYKGGSPYTNGSLELARIQPPSTMMFGDVFPTESWMATTNEKGYGVGLFVQDNYEWKRGYFGSDLSGGEFSTVASYIAATNRVILDYNLVYEWDYELVLGNLNKIRSYMYSKPRSSAGPNYRFDTSRKGWYYQKATDTGWPILGKLHVSLNESSNNNRITSPYVFWKGSSNPKIYLRAAFQTQHDKFRLKWRRSEDQTLYDMDDRYVDFPIINDGKFHTYEIDLSHNDNWLNHNIGQIQFGTVPEGPTINGWAKVEWISSSENGPVEQTVTAPVAALPSISTPIVNLPVAVQAPVAAPCEPGCAPVIVKKLYYVRSNRKR
ncbi:hypothetical protein [Spirosoma flavum]|uniref:Uncharacterized protein n=1 Tax=Spirosoma flavum TaxID=2048557 RepID=A0ABW6ANH1_9BACT